MGPRRPIDAFCGRDTYELAAGAWLWFPPGGCGPPSQSCWLSTNLRAEKGCCLEVPRRRLDSILVSLTARFLHQSLVAAEARTLLEDLLFDPFNLVAQVLKEGRHLLEDLGGGNAS